MNRKLFFLLASQSPRRRDLLSLTGWPFRVVPAAVDETHQAGESPASYVRRLAVAKARAGARLADERGMILGADTAVVDGGDIIGKPADAAEAIRMLRRLRGRTHLVFSSIAVLQVAGGNLRTDLCVTEVPMRAYSDAELSDYVRSGDPLDKAGAYAIQHPDFQPVASLQGCYANVVGLPLCHLLRTLQRMNIQPELDVPAKCQDTLQYQCPVFESVLRANA